MTVLTRPARSRLTAELEDLRDRRRPELLRLAADVDGRDPADQAERSQREMELFKLDQRIARLTDLLADEQPTRAAGSATESVQLGSLVDLDFGDGQPQRVMLGDLVLSLSETPVVTVDSPLGRALLGSGPGQTLTYRGPSRELSATVLAVHES